MTHSIAIAMMPRALLLCIIYFIRLKIIIVITLRYMRARCVIKCPEKILRHYQLENEVITILRKISIILKKLITRKKTLRDSDNFFLKINGDYIA